MQTEVDGKLMTLARFTRMLAKHSPCKRRGVACVVFEPESWQVIGWGVNEPARGRICSGEKDNCGCMHSEVNTILNTRPRDWWCKNYMIVSRAPCVPCAGVIVNCGFITKVFVLDESEPGAHGIGILRSAGIAVEDLVCPFEAEVGLRDKTMAASAPGTLDLAKLKEESLILRDKIARNSGSVEDYSRLQEIERQIKQIS